MGCDFTFIHCADLHLGSRFWGLNRKDPELGRRMYGSTFKAFSRIVDLGLQRADFMVIAGDVYDELVETPRTRSFFASELERFGKPVFMVTGNHDHVHSWSDSIPYPKNVKQFSTVPHSYKARVRDRQIEIAGVSFDGPHTDENLVSKLRGTPGMFTIGVVHCSVDTAGEGSGYSPCTERDFLNRDIQYWALGHIHKRMTIRASDPTVVYPGNIQGRNPNESGEKGCLLVSVTGEMVETEFVPVQDMVWKDVTLDISGKNTLRELVEEVRPELSRDAIVSLTITGRGPLNTVLRRDPEGFADNLENISGCVVNLKKIITGPEIDLERERDSGTLLSEIIKVSDSLYGMTDQELLDMLCSKGPAADLRPYLQYYADKGKLRELVREAEMSTIGRLSEVRE
ncbi:MAG: DNA repair exonuclease [Candidatus Methanomethylophilus sp.]|nr:DNA repair exonuclease [Methanomethylophilus sp.]